MNTGCTTGCSVIAKRSQKTGRRHAFFGNRICTVAILAGLCLLGSPAIAQLNSGTAYSWSTIAGRAGVGQVDGIGTVAQFFAPEGVAVDSSGNIYVADSRNDTIRRITPAGVVTTIAGFPGAPGSADGTNSAARFNQPLGIAVDAAGNLYVTDGTVRMIAPVGTNWVVTTIAGGGSDFGESSGDGTNFLFLGLSGIASDPSGNIYVADGSRICAISPQTLMDGKTHWIVRTIAGNSIGFYGEADGTGTNALFGGLSGISVDSQTNVYVVDQGNEVIRQVSPVGTDWAVSTIAGVPGEQGLKNGAGTNAEFFLPIGITVASPGLLYVADQANYQIRQLTYIPPMMGMGTTNGGYWNVTTFVGNSGAGSTDGTGTNASFGQVAFIAADSDGNVFVSDQANNDIRMITSAGLVTTLAGSAGPPGSADGTGSSARFAFPSGVTADKNGNVYVADTFNDTIRKITAAGAVTTLAGLAGQSGELDQTGNIARFNQPTGVALDGLGNLYVADNGGNSGRAIRYVTAAGVVSTLPVSGLGQGPYGIALDAHGTVYVTDSGDHTVQQLEPPGPKSIGWTARTIAGVAGTPGYADGSNTISLLSSPAGIVVDSSSNVYVADRGNFAIRQITPAGTNWVVTTIAIYEQGSTNESTTNSLLEAPCGLGIDTAGNLYVGEFGAIQILKPQGTNWVSSTIGGAGLASTGQVLGYGSADGPGSVAKFSDNLGIGVDFSGAVLVADYRNNTIRKGVFSGFGNTNLVPYTPPLMTGSLMVTLIPTVAGGQWRFPWEFAWRDSGTIASNLAPDNYTIEYKNVPGYLTISTNYTVAVTNGGTIFVTNQYYPSALTPTTGVGTLTVNMPNAPSGAAWGFLGGSNSLPNGLTTNLVAGAYLVGFQPVAGYSTPANQSVQVVAGKLSVISVSYLMATPPPANVLFPVPVPAGNIADTTDYPFGFNGQLLSDVGSGSGVAVQTNVVLSAAHMVFNNQTLSYVSAAYWFFRKEAGTFAPEPMAARGWYILGSYASQRTNDLGHGYSVDESSAESRNLDVAALYFTKPVAGGGFGGFLPSDTVPNPWLSGTTEKMLVGYPVDGSLFGDTSIVPGQMYQTSPQPYPLNLDPNSVNGQQDVYDADWFLGYPGDSGGPVYVQFDGYFYPAGVFLGINYNGSSFVSLVRGLDSNVVNMVTLAQLQGDGGTNDTGDGLVVIIPNASVNTNNPGYIQWDLEPPAAVRAGAAWRLAGDASYSDSTNYIRTVLTTNALMVQFKPIPGWHLPAAQSISARPNYLTVSTGFYTVASPMLKASPGSGIGLIGTTGTTYRIDARTSLINGNWVPVSTNTITTTGLNPILPPPAFNQPATFYRAVWLP